MKKLIYYILIVIVFASCKKEKITEEVDEKMEELKEEFDTLVTENGEQINSILGRESSVISNDLQKVITLINHQISENGANTVAEITDTSNSLSNAESI